MQFDSTSLKFNHHSDYPGENPGYAWEGHYMNACFSLHEPSEFPAVESLITLKIATVLLEILVGITCIFGGWASYHHCKKVLTDLNMVVR